MNHCRCQLDHLVERARLREQVPGTGDDLQASRAAEPLEGLLVQLQDAAVASAHDQQRRRPDVAQQRASHVGSPAARDHGGDVRWHPRRSDQRRRGTGARPEVADRQVRDVVLLQGPEGGRGEAPGQQFGVEHLAAIAASLSVRRSSSKVARPACRSAVAT